MDTGDGEKTTTRSPEQSSEAESTVGDALDIENALSEVPGTEADIDETDTTGQVTEARKLSTEAVPDTYPVAIESDHAVGFRVRISVDRETMVYLAWPETYDQSADLAVLLNSLDIPPDRFADIIGAELDLVVVEGQWVPEVAVESARPHPAAEAGEAPSMPEDGTAEEPDVVMNDGTVAVVRDERGTRVVSAKRLGDTSAQSNRTKRTVEPVVKDDPDTDPNYYYGVLGIGGLWTAVVFGLLTGFHILPTGVTALLLLVSPVAFPFVIYRDAEHVAAHSEWSPHIAWTIASVFWLVNTIVFLCYVYKRRKAMPADKQLLSR
jgi:hypothetical protein